MEDLKIWGNGKKSEWLMLSEDQVAKLMSNLPDWVEGYDLKPSK